MSQIFASGILEAPPPTFSALESDRVAADLFGLRVRSELLTGERDLNVLITCDNGRRFVMKVSNPAEDPEITDLQTAALCHLEETDPDLPVPRLLRGRDGLPQQTFRLSDGRSAIVRVLTFLPGAPLYRTPTSPQLRANLAVCLARVDHGLSTFSHRAQDHELEWNIANLPRLLPLLRHVDRRRLTLVESIFDQFSERVLPMLGTLRSQVIYNDLNSYNVLVCAEDNSTVTGIIDFGDIVRAPLVNDLAVAASYQFGVSEEGLIPVGEFVSAYHKIMPLRAEEIDLLPDLIAARLATTVLITGWRAMRHPENSQYILRNNPAAWAALELIGTRSADELQDWARRACELET